MRAKDANCSLLRCAVNGLPSPEQRLRSYDAPNLLAQPAVSENGGAWAGDRPNSWDVMRANASQQMAMPLQKITLFRKSVDGDGTAPSSRNVGIGIACETDQYTGHVAIQKVFVGGAAHNSGQVFPSDTLLQINGTSVTGMPTHQVLQMLGGEAGTPVSILVSHHPQQAPPRVLPPQMADAPQQNERKLPSVAEQEAEERRLAREKVLAARRMSFNAATSGGLQDNQTVAKTDSRPQRHSLAPSSRTAGENPSDGVRGQKDLRTVLREAHDGRPSPPVSAVYPVPPAALKNSNLPLAIAPADQTVQNGHGQIYGETSKLSMQDLVRSSSAEAGSPPEGSYVFSKEADETSPPRTDAEGKSLAELKMSFTMRMNEAIRMQRERMRVLLSDVDSKIVSLKNEHGIKELLPDTTTSKGFVPSTPDVRAQPTATPHVDVSDNKENDSRYFLLETKAPLQVSIECQ